MGTLLKLNRVESEADVIEYPASGLVDYQEVWERLVVVVMQADQEYLIWSEPANVLKQKILFIKLNLKQNLNI